MMVLFLLGVLLISPFVLAQEQSKTYSGFNQFIDNVRMFFTFGQDGKVALSLEIREKEVNSAIVNTKNENNGEAEKNLERAWEKLQFIQEKVSLKTAEEVKESSSKVLDTINQEENISDSLEVYSLEEEKTGLTAEWVIEVNGKEGQNLSNEIVVNGSEGRTMEIENRIDEIDGEISNWVVEHTYAEGTTAGGEAGVVVEGGLATVVKTEVAQGDDGLKPEVKTYVAGDGTQNEEPLPEPNPNQVNPDLETHDTTTNNIDEAPGGIDSGYAEGTTADGSGDSGSEGVNEEPSPAVESNEGDAAPTREAVKEIKSSGNFLTRFFKILSGK